MEILKTKPDKLKRMAAAVLLGSVALTGCGQVVEAKGQPTLQTVEVEQPLPTPEIVRPDKMDQLRNAWEMEMINQPGEVDIAVYDLETGQTAQWNTPGATTFSTASIVKYAVLAETLRQHQADGRQLSSYDYSQAAAMIGSSDNAATTYLWNKLGGKSAMQHFFDTVAGTTSTTASGSWGVTQTTALDQLQVLKLATMPGGPLTLESKAIMTDMLADVVPYQRWGISGGVPDDVSVWLKNGWLYDSATNNKYSHTSSWTVNSIGNVGNRYLLAVLSAGNPVGSNRAEQNGIDRIENLSRITWDIMSAQNQ